MDVRYEYNIKRALTFMGDEFMEYIVADKEYDTALAEYNALTAEEQEQTEEPIKPDMDDYYIRDGWNPSVVKLNFDKPKIVHIYGLNAKDLISFSNNFDKDNWYTGEWLRAGAMMSGEIGGSVTIRCFKNTPSLYLMLADGGSITVYAEDISYNRA